jgi:aminocarboxymuconate-semialdehyde decarboxylase
VGSDRVLFGTDYPHQVHDIKGSLANTAALPAPVCQAIRDGNARAMFEI